MKKNMLSILIRNSLSLLAIMILGVACKSRDFGENKNQVKTFAGANESGTWNYIWSHFKVIKVAGQETNYVCIWAADNLNIASDKTYDFNETTKEGKTSDTVYVTTLNLRGENITQTRSNPLGFFIKYDEFKRYVYNQITGPDESKKIFLEYLERERLNEGVGGPSYSGQMAYLFYRDADFSKIVTELRANGARDVPFDASRPCPNSKEVFGDY
jgi:hypothetical protein